MVHLAGSNRESRRRITMLAISHQQNLEALGCKFIERNGRTRLAFRTLKSHRENIVGLDKAFFLECHAAASTKSASASAPIIATCFLLSRTFAICVLPMAITVPQQLWLVERYFCVKLTLL